MEPHGYSHLICFSFAWLTFELFTLRYIVDMSLERETSVLRRANHCCHASRPYSIRLSHLPVLFPVSMFLFHWEKGNRRPKVCARRGKADGLLVWLGFDVTASTPATYQRHRL